METLEIIINGIIELSTMDVLESLQDNTVFISGSKKSLFTTKKIDLAISKSQDDVAAYVTLIKNGSKYTLDIHKDILYDILKRTNLLDQKLNMKLDIIFNNRKLEFKDGKLIIK